MFATMPDVEALNDRVRGFTTVEALTFDCDLADNACRLELTLRRHLVGQGQRLVVVFHGVSGLALSGFGGGLTQIMCLRAVDVRSAQHDRINFEVRDLENEAMSFRCRGFHYELFQR